METLDNIGIKLFVLAALKERYLYLLLFFCMFGQCSASVSALQIVFSNCMKVLQNGIPTDFQRG